MGYDTKFSGQFNLDRSLDVETKQLLHMLSTTRRMKRSLEKIATKEGTSIEDILLKYGEDGQLYFDRESQDHSMSYDDTVLDPNNPPAGQPGLWCDWKYNEEKCCIEWNRGEKFYEYIAWIEYIIYHILSPKNYILNGRVYFQGEDPIDYGCIDIQSNVVTISPDTCDDIMDISNNKQLLSMFDNLRKMLEKDESLE